MFALNRDNRAVQACQHETMAADAFAGMQHLAQQGRRFGLVVVDPPSFANSQQQVRDALKAYYRLAQLALNLVDSNGLLVMASCSSRVSPDEFYATVHQAAIDKRTPLREIERTGHGVDHPLLPSFPEGRYLKCLFAKAQ